MEARFTSALGEEFEDSPPAPDAAPPPTPARIARRLVAAIEKGDVDAFAESFAEDALGYHPLSPEPLRGRAAIKAAEDALFHAFSDVRVDVKSILADERKCALEVLLHAMNTGPLDLGGDTPIAPTGRTVEVPATWWYVVGDDGLIIEAHDYFDTSTFLAQLGIEQEPHVDRAGVCPTTCDDCP